jgi:hypothetical protein
LRPQSGHHTSSSLRAMNIDCQTPTCFLGLHPFHSDVVSRVARKAQAASSFHRVRCSALSSHVLWKKRLWPSWLNAAETSSSLCIGLPQPAQFSISLEDNRAASAISGECYPDRFVLARTRPAGEISKRQEDLQRKRCKRGR